MEPQLTKQHTSNRLAMSLAQTGRLKVRWHPRLETAPAAIPQGVDITDKIQGMLLGLAIGDSLGNTSESRRPADRLRDRGWIDGYLPNRHAGGRRVGLPSDDTQMAFWTIEHLLAGKRLDPQLLGEAFSRRPIYGIGSSVRSFLGHFKAGLPWPQCGAPSSGNGALMRVAPILLPHLATPSADLWGDTLLAAHLTHDDELSNVSCLAMVDMLWQLIGMSAAPTGSWWIDHWLNASDDLGDGTAYESRNGHPPGFKGTLGELFRQYLQPAFDADMEVMPACDIWHSGAYLLETVPTVVYILATHGSDPKSAILQAVNCSRDNDTVAAIVGAAVGALHGANALPKTWVDGLLGRTGANDDGRVFELIISACEKFVGSANGQTQDPIAWKLAADRLSSMANGRLE